MKSQSLSIVKRTSMPGGAPVSESKQGEQGTCTGTGGLAPRSPNGVRRVCVHGCGPVQSVQT